MVAYYCAMFSICTLLCIKENTPESLAPSLAELLVYFESIPKLRQNPSGFDPAALHRTAELFRTFGENYHERMLEEQHIFPMVRKQGPEAPDGDFQPVEGDPVPRGQRACLFQHIFHGRFYGYDCHLQPPSHWMLEEVEAPLP